MAYGGKGYSSNTGRMDNYPDDVLLIKDGVPHYTGEKMELLKEYKRCVEILLAKADAQKEPEDRTKRKGWH